MNEVTTTSRGIKINGMIFDAPVRYKAGDTINENEAKALNQTMAENLRNNFASKVKKAAEENGGQISAEAASKLHEEFAAYASAYEFSKKAVAQVVDPVEKLALRLAAEAIRTSFREKKLDLKTLPEGRFDEMCEELVAKRPWYMEEAGRRVEANKQAAAQALESL